MSKRQFQRQFQNFNHCYVAAIKIQLANAQEPHRKKTFSFEILCNLVDNQDDRRSKEKKFEDDLMQTIKNGKFDEIESKITPRAFKYCESNALLMGMKVGSVTNLVPKVFSAFQMAAWRRPRPDKQQITWPLSSQSQSPLPI